MWERALSESTSLISSSIVDLNWNIWIEAKTFLNARWYILCIGKDKFQAG